jgi:nicotinate-nucleotide adenylyltransferase
VKRLGLLGGTFDPPHLAHLILAEAAREQLQLDRVLFLPAGQPPHKPEQPVTPASHRLAMTALAIADNTEFVIDETDVRREPPHYTATLLPLLLERLGPAQLWLLIGGDSLRDLPTWYRPKELLRYCRLAVLPRPGATVDWTVLDAAVPETRDKVDMLDGPTISLSSTALRGRAGEGKSLRYLVPEAVRRYISDNSLYGDAGSSPPQAS